VAKRRTVVGTIILATLATLLFVVLVRWWQSPSPETEAAKYFERLAPGSVEVIDCNYAEDPEGSEYDHYLCSLNARRYVPRGSPGAADIPRGRSTYCFTIPRSAAPWHRRDDPAFPGYRARSSTDCA